MARNRIVDEQIQMDVMKLASLKPNVYRNHRTSIFQTKN
jgi:hypothetical protein